MMPFNKEALPARRPPKPKPFPFGGRITEEDNADSEEKKDSSSVSMKDNSERSRESLRRFLGSRRSSLTPQEHGFLEHLCDHGNEVEVNLAHSKLLDEDLFFEPPEEFISSDMIQYGREQSITSTSSEEHPNVLLENLPERSTSVRTSSSGCASSSSLLGSERRLEQLEERKKSITHGKIWKAHENGIALSKMGSRRSLVVRSNSVARNRRSLLQAQRDEIFRSWASSSDLPMNDINSDNNRNVSWSGFSSRGSFKAPKRPSLRRMQSEGSRKSVTFSTDLPPPRRASRSSSVDYLSQSPPSIRHAAPVRSESMSSIPSLHHANRIRSASMSSMSSFPSLHLAEPLRSQSFRSCNASSVTSFESSLVEGRDPSETGPGKRDTCSPSPVPSNVDIPHEESEAYLQEDLLPRPVLMRKASCSAYDGEGIEVADWEVTRPQFDTSSLNAARKLGSLASFADTTIASVRSSNSFDETMSFNRVNAIFRRHIQRSLSDDDMAGIFLGRSRLLLRESSTLKEIQPSTVEESDSWNLDTDEDLDFYDAWKVVEDEYENGYGGGGTFPFYILGTSASDVEAHPHVLSPPLMESLQAFLPLSKVGENFWMKYSLVRDGASLHTFLQHARGAKVSFIAIETVDGEVFGSFTTEPWRKNWNYFGGAESFLWRMQHSRHEKCHSIIDQAHMESEIEVYPFTGENSCIQLCTHDKIAVGGGTADSHSAEELNDSLPKKHHWGFGLTIEGDFLHGTSSPCLTFASPSLSKVHPNGELFEIMNLELWTLTPCNKLEEAEKLELGRLFLEAHRKQ